MLAAFCTAGYGWICWQISNNGGPDLKMCMLRRITGIPCPSCGTTRSVLSLLQGDFGQALSWNPFGLLVMPPLMIIPAWIAYDLYTHKRSLYEAWSSFNRNGMRSKYIVPATIIVVFNWLWNIYKYY